MQRWPSGTTQRQFWRSRAISSSRYRRWSTTSNAPKSITSRHSTLPTTINMSSNCINCDIIRRLQCLSKQRVLFLEALYFCSWTHSNSFQSPRVCYEHYLWCAMLLRDIIIVDWVENLTYHTCSNDSLSIVNDKRSQHGLIFTATE